MRKYGRIVFVVLLVAAGYWLWERASPLGDDTIEYRGQKIKLSKRYNSYEAYKDDPGNIDPAENVRVQKLVMEAPVASSYANRKEMVTDAFEIKFPGYGLGSIGGQSADGTPISGVTIEIPRTEKDRVLLFRERGGRLELVDDFVSEAPIASAREEDGYYRFFDGAGKESLRRPVKKP
jgi:hypothetical protein